ncbi:MAG: hypothetical protein Q9190_001408 [Brigantiaea leucoxantha]
MAHHQQTGPDRIHAAQDLSISSNNPTARSSQTNSDDDAVSEVDEPPDDQLHFGRVSLSCHRNTASSKEVWVSPSVVQDRKASLLTRALLLSPDSTPASDAEAPVLTSDGGLTSPTRTNSPSPPLPAMRPPPELASVVPKDLTLANGSRGCGRGVTSVQSTAAHEAPATDLEQGLGRRRCIKFACGRQSASTDETSQTSKNTADTSEHSSQTAGHTKRPCMLKFVCPMRPSGTGQNVEASRKHSEPHNITHPSPPLRRSSSSTRPDARRHRGSGSTVRNPPANGSSRSPVTTRHRKSSEFKHPNLEDSEATRFHEFAGPYIREDEWTREQPVFHKKITVNDTLQKENAIRKLGEEAEEEALEEDLEEDETLGDVENADGGAGGATAGKAWADDISDGGNESDNEAGFAESDDDSDLNSEYEFWTPGVTTAATSIEHLEHIRPATQRKASNSSMESMINVKQSETASRGSATRARRPVRSHDVKMRPGTPDLPDSTDFVCGTLDEDRPLEAAYMSCLEERRRSKHRIIPQDIDPSFPTSDPENESDDEGVENTSDHGSDGVWVTGRPDNSEEESTPLKRIPLSRRSTKPTASSPKRLRSPPPPLHKRGNMHRSPPLRMPFGRSPNPAPLHVIGQTGNGSPSVSEKPASTSPPKRSANIAMLHLPERPQLTRTTSLPKTPNPFWLKRNGRCDVTSSTNISPTVKGPEIHSRGPIDIVKGLEKKRQRRKEKFWRQHCRNTGKEKERRCQPGKGAERMRELGLEIAGKGKAGPPKAQLVLSI